MMKAFALIPLPIVFLTAAVTEVGVASVIVLRTIGSGGQMPTTLLSVLSGIAVTVPIVTAIAIWFGRDHFKLSEMHDQNTRKLDHIIHLVEGEEGLLDERKLNRRRRHQQMNQLQVIHIQLYMIEKYLERVSVKIGIPYEPIADKPHHQPPYTEGEPEGSRRDDN